MKCFLSFVPNFEQKAEDGRAETMEARDVVTSLWPYRFTDESWPKTNQPTQSPTN